MPAREVCTRIVVLISVVLGAGQAQGENWPCWRGPRGDGTVTDSRLPQTWDAESGENILWKARIPGRGHSSPIVWDNRIFVTTCLEDSQQRCLLCLDADTGRVLWQTTVVTSVLETRHRLNSYASATPATDGRAVFVTFLVTDGKTVPAQNVGTPRDTTTGRIFVAAYDMTGRQLWNTDAGAFTSVHGFCSSPILYQDFVIINGDHDGDSYITALNKNTGQQVWKRNRTYKTRSYCTPIIRQTAQRTQMVFSGSKRIVSLNPRTGEPWWHIEGPTEQFVSSPVFDGHTFFVTAGFPTHHVMAIRPDGIGDVTNTHVAWHSTEAKCYVPSPVLINRLLFVADDRGTANCFDTTNGKRVWRDRLGKHFSASLLAAGGLAWFFADDGKTFLVDPEQNFAVVAENRLNEYTYASPAAAHDRLYIRAEEHLFAIGRTNPVATKIEKTPEETQF